MESLFERMSRIARQGNDLPRLSGSAEEWARGATMDEIMAFRATDYFIGKTPEQRNAGLKEWLIETGRLKP